ncbi:MAG: hypothetical protein ABI835_08290 [Chloroflexota bacterium]
MRKLSCCIALVLMLGISGAAFAQTTMPIPCGDLSDADCEILTNAQAASATLDSALFDMSFNLNVSDMPDMTEPFALSMTGSGSFAGLGALHDMASSMTTGMTDMAALEGHLGELVSGVLSGFDGDINLTIDLPEEVLNQSGGNVPDTLTIQARMVDGFAYLNTDTLTSLTRGMNLSGWYGIDLASLVSGAMEKMPTGMFDSSRMMQGQAMQDYMAAVADPEFVNSFVSVERTDDGSGDTAVFEFSFDFAALMSSQAFQDLMNAQMEMQAGMSGGSAMTEKQMGEAMAMASQMLKSVSMTMTEEIGLEDGFVHGISGTMNIDTSRMMAMMGEMMGSSPSSSSTEAAPGDSSSMQAAPTLSIDFAVNFSSFNSAPEITAPEDAIIIPYRAILRNLDHRDDMSDSTPPVAAVEMTPTATTAVATVEATPVSTAESTAEVTAEATTQATAEATAQATAEATAEPTAEATPAS